MENKSVNKEKFLSRLSTRFINTPGQKVDHEINRALAELGEFAGSDRTYVFLFLDDQGTMCNSHEWCAPGIPPFIQELVCVRPEDQPWVVQKLRRFEALEVPDVEELPAEASIEKDMFRHQGIKSLLAVPVAHELTLYGLVGMDFVREKRPWDADTVSLFRTVGEIISNALARRDAEQELRAAELSLKASNETLRRRDLIMKALHVTAEAFLRQPDWRKGIPEVLKRICEVPGISFVTVFEKHPEFPPDQLVITALHFGDEELDKKFRRFQHIGFDENVLSSQWLSSLREGKEYEHCAYECTVIKHFGIRPVENFQLLDIPISLRKQWHGFIRFGGEEEKEPWSEPEIDALASVAGIFGAALQGERQDKELRVKEEGLRHSEKIAAIGRLAGGIAHDFNNLLTVVVGYGELLLEVTESDGQAKRWAEEILDAADKAHDLTRQLLTFSRSHAIEPQQVNVRRLIENMLKMLQRLIGEEIQLSFNPSGSREIIWADRGQIEQVVMNIVVNARDAISENGQIEIKTDDVVLNTELDSISGKIPAGDYLRLTISDNGSGIDPLILPQVFDPFFTTKPAGKGTGMGLAMVFGIVKQNHGYLHVVSHPGEGTQFQILFPPSSESENKTSSDEVFVSSSRPVWSGKVLVAEDEALVRELLENILGRMGFEVISAKNGFEAITMARDHGEGPRLLVSDVVMPEMNGRQLYTELTRDYPNIPVLFISGYPDEMLDEDVLEAGRILFLQKPFTSAELVEKLKELLGSNG